MKRAWLLAVACLAASLPALGSAQRSRGPGKVVYAVSQASEGAQVYDLHCAVCHGPMLGGSLEIPGLRGKFMANWAGRPVGDLFDYVARAMPQPMPGSLSDADNARLVAFLLRENGLAGGSVPLSTDRAVLSRIMLEPVPPR